MNCGSRLARSNSAGLGEAKSTEFDLDRYLPQELVTKLEYARARNSTVGERRVITMLFCDVKGSTAAAEKVDPEIWTDIMNGVFEHMIRPIYKYEGLVPRLMGDAILAFFGAPITHEDDPQRAVLAGLEIQKGITSYAEEIRRKHGLEFGLRVGINTGLVVVGEIGSDLRMEYTAIGDAVNLAARMEQTASVGTIQISEETYKLVAPFFEVEPLGKVEVKGKSAPIKTYRVLGVKSTPGHLRGLEGLSSPLIGRDAQLALLHRRLRRLEKGAGSFVAVIGEAGLGKSTLIAELKKSYEAPRYQWLRGDALSYTRSISYFPWKQIIRQSIDVRETDSPADVREKLRYKCDCCAVPGGDLPFLEAMLAVEDEESFQIVTGVQGDALIQKMVDATRGYLCGLAMESLPTIIFDDLHWADEASLNLLLSLSDLADTHPILFICMLRPDKTAPSWNSIEKIQGKLQRRFDTILLEPLQAEQTDVMVTNLLGVEDLPKSIRDLIVEKADGNPFFVEEIIRSLIETKQIVRETGHWIATGDSTKILLPNTLRGVLSARIDRLPEIAKHVLQNAAVIGRSFDLSVLKRLVGLNGTLDSPIRYLQEASLIEAAHDEYAFRHVLIQEAAYESILIKRRAELHRQIGQVLEELHADRTEEFAPLLAHHFYAGQDERSLKYDLIAAEKSARLYANAEAAAHFGRALQVAKQTEIGPEQRVNLYIQYGSVLELSGRFEQALETYEELETFGRQSENPAIEMKALMARATIYSIFSQLHNVELSQQMLIKALEISREIGDHVTQAKLNWNLMITYLFSKRLDESLRHGEIALALARESEDREQLAFVLNDLCRLHTCRGEFEQAHASVREARQLWQALDNQVMLADSLGSESEAYFNAGEYQKSLEYSEQALQISQKVDNLWGQAYNCMLMSFVCFETGELGDGIQLAEQSIQLADNAGLIAGSISLRSELGWVYAYCGAFDKGLGLIEQALQVAAAKQPGWQSFPLAAKVRIYLMQDRVRAAEEISNGSLLQPTSIPYARFTIFICLANVELAIMKGEYAQALSLIEELLDEVASLTRVDVPNVLYWKGVALSKLKRYDEALPALAEARSMATRFGAKPQLWHILAILAEINVTLGNENEVVSSRTEARSLVVSIAESLRELGLRDSFLNQPEVQKLMREY